MFERHPEEKRCVRCGIPSDDSIVQRSGTGAQKDNVPLIVGISVGVAAAAALVVVAAVVLIRRKSAPAAADYEAF